MKDLKALKEEQLIIKNNLAELVDFISSEEYFVLSDKEKNLISQQRAGMELYLSALTKRLYENETCFDYSGTLWPLILMSFFNIPSYTPSTSPTLESLKKELDSQNTKEI